MPCKKLLLLILLLFVCFNGFSAVFVVTSNADSGPGTLRDALTQAAANGSAEKDYINFNFADLSEAGRTITVLSQLPDISPNLVIDGTTQPGANFGVSDAKVKIYNNFTPDNLYYPVIFNADNVGNFTLSGLYLSALGYAGQTNLFSLIVSNSTDVDIEHCLLPNGKVEIDSCKSLSLKSNMIGYLPDGVTGYTTGITVNNTLNIVVGGTPAEGNFLGGSLTLNMYNWNKDWTYIINNNKMGTDYTGVSSSPEFWSQGRIDVESGHYDPPSTGRMHGTIINNLIENFSATGIMVSGFGDVDIKGNSIETDKTGTIDFYQFAPDYVKYSLGWAPTAIWLQVGIDATVGGSNPGEGNVIGYTSNAILEQLADHVVISENSIFCQSRNYFNMHDLIAYPKPLPEVEIDNYTSASISGTATPGARVELFYNTAEGSDCPYCGAKFFFAFVMADSQGHWSYSGVIPPGVVASAIYGNQTSHFTQPKIDSTNLIVTQPKCGDKSGSIKGFKFYNASGVQWVDQEGNVISTSTDINDLPPGLYQLQIGSGACGVKSNWITIVDNRPKIDTSNLKRQFPSCNKNGAISGITAISNQNEKLTYSWKDQNSKEIGTTADIAGLTPGNYTLMVTGAVTGCSITFGPVIFKNTPGPYIDQTKQNIQSTNCGQSTGSITNITVTGTGTLKHIWRDSNHQTVGTDKDLLNQPAGTYKLQVTDDTQCGPIYTTDIVIPETNGITMDESKAQTTIAMCGLDNGSITGIQVTGAAKYVWAYGNNTVATTTPDLLNMPPGDYVLTASNGFGCSKISQSYHIGQQLATKFPVYASLIMTSCFKGNDGWIEITTDSSVKSLRWVDGQGQNVGTKATLAGVGPGVYQLYLTDQNGCESFYNSYTVREFPEYTVALYGTVTTDKCGLSTGAVSATTITGGLPPYTYQWRDVNNNPLAATNAISNLSAGTYILNVVDTRCGNVDITYTIAEDSENIPAPSASNVQLCSAGNALLRVNNAQASVTYRLYDNPSSPHIIDEQKGGSFKVNVTANQSFYISQLNGTCESERAEMQVTVGLSAKDIVNTFTPNGDGVNDYWKINSIESYPQASIQVFTRYGQLVFNSIGYAHPFDGTFSGKKLPAGVYYYVINLGTSCKILSGSLTIIR